MSLTTGLIINIALMATAAVTLGYVMATAYQLMRTEPRAAAPSIVTHPSTGSKMHRFNRLWKLRLRLGDRDRGRDEPNAGPVHF